MKLLHHQKLILDFSTEFDFLHFCFYLISMTYPMGYRQVLQHIAIPICTDHGFFWAKQVEFFSFKLLLQHLRCWNFKTHKPRTYKWKKNPQSRRSELQSATKLDCCKMKNSFRYRKQLFWGKKFQLWLNK